MKGQHTVKDFSKEDKSDLLDNRVQSSHHNNQCSPCLSEKWVNKVRISTKRRYRKVQKGVSELKNTISELNNIVEKFKSD